MKTTLAICIIAVLLAGCQTVTKVETDINTLVGAQCDSDIAATLQVANTLDPAGVKCATAYGVACKALTGVACPAGSILCPVEKLRVGRIEQNAVNAACVGVTVP